MKNILLIGGGGHCASVADALIRTKEYDKIGIIDFKDKSPLFDLIPIVGCDDDLSELKKEYDYAFVTVGSVGHTALRQKLYSMIQELGFTIPNIIDPSAVVSENAELGNGIFVGKNAVINARSRIGNAAIINTGAIVEHDCDIGSFAHISPRATLCGRVIVGDNTHIGAGAVIKQGIKVGKGSMIGMGSVVIHNIVDGVLVVGNPAKYRGGIG